MITKQPLCAAIRKPDTDTRAVLSQVLNLGHNQLQGQLTISGMSSLRALMLNDNMLTGLAGAPPAILCPPFMFPRLKTLLNVCCWHPCCFHHVVHLTHVYGTEHVPQIPMHWACASVAQEP